MKTDLRDGFKMKSLSTFPELQGDYVRSATLQAVETCCKLSILSCSTHCIAQDARFNSYTSTI